MLIVYLHRYRKFFSWQEIYNLRTWLYIDLTVESGWKQSTKVIVHKYLYIKAARKPFQSPVLIMPNVIVNLSLIFLFLGGIFHLNETQTTDCSNTCMLRARCTPYYKDLVWSVVDRVCRVFQNGCIFANENCMRANRCLPRKLVWI